MPRRVPILDSVPAVAAGVVGALGTMLVLKVGLRAVGVFNGPARGVVVPIVILCGIAAGVWMTWHLRAQFALAEDTALGTRCRCGYDLRVTDCRCPECGEFIPLPLQDGMKKR